MNPSELWGFPIGPTYGFIFDGSEYGLSIFAEGGRDGEGYDGEDYRDHNCLHRLSRGVPSLCRILHERIQPWTEDYCRPGSNDRRDCGDRNNVGHVGKSQRLDPTNVDGIVELLIR